MLETVQISNSDETLYRQGSAVKISRGSLGIIGARRRVKIQGSLRSIRRALTQGKVESIGV